MEEDHIEIVNRLLEIMNQANLVEIELERDGLHVRLKKAQPQGSGIIAVTPATLTEAAASAAPAREPTAQETAQEYEEIVSPMVGTFYPSPSPDADVFVDVGDPVDETTVVCIIEAMKVFNEIRAEKTGRIVEVLVENGDAVEFGQPLFLVDARG